MDELGLMVADDIAMSGSELWPTKRQRRNTNKKESPTQNIRRVPILYNQPDFLRRSIIFHVVVFEPFIGVDRAWLIVLVSESELDVVEWDVIKSLNF